MHSHADVADIPSKAQLLLVIQKGSVQLASFGHHDAQSKRFAQRSWIKSSESAVEAEALSSPTHNTSSKSSYCESKSSSVMSVSTTLLRFTRTNTPSSSSAVPSLDRHICKIILDQSHLALVYVLFASEGLTNLAAICARNGNDNRHRSQQTTHVSQRPGKSSYGVSATISILRRL